MPTVFHRCLSFAWSAASAAVSMRERAGALAANYAGAHQAHHISVGGPGPRRRARQHRRLMPPVLLFTTDNTHQRPPCRTCSACAPQMYHDDRAQSCWVPAAFLGMPPT